MVSQPQSYGGSRARQASKGAASIYVQTSLSSGFWHFGDGCYNLPNKFSALIENFSQKTLEWYK
jgi:hypothetical protein